MERSLLAPLVLVAAALVLPACGTERACGPGTRLEGERCVPVEAGGPTCGAGTHLVDGACVPVVENPDGGEPTCVPSCVGRNCGDDGCGGTCGTCDTAAAPVCNTVIGRCVATCIPVCAGRNCGDDGCGGTCGSCGDGDSCSAGRCVPDAWTCDDAWYGAGDACDCGCGTRDADCAVTGMPIAGCEALQTCSNEGTCVSRVPATWTCAADRYGALDGCDCGCGTLDPDCEIETLPVVGCGFGVNSCNEDGTCPTCTPDCTGKSCGDDGCGGLCGLCNDPARSACVAGSCVSACNPSPVRCTTAECGDDGCGGTCGTCGAGSSCAGGFCQRDTVEVGPNSCVGRCGTIAPGGCSCTANCAATGDCCPDRAQACTCVPSCAGKTCGSNGCGGSCGTCSGANPICNAAGQCTNTCTPDCTGKACGDDGCGGSCGTCGAGKTCIWTHQCLPDTWTCDSYLYGDQRGCDCGCGAVDPDCSASDATVYGCPTRGTQCTAQGLCNTTFCDANADCTSGKWCVGTYTMGGGRVGGTCDAPVAEAEPPGSVCSIGAECASGVCLGGLCRQYCQADAECPAFQNCIALAVRDPVTKVVRGYAGVCELIAGSAVSCGSQAACDDETCIALADPVTLAPRYFCSDVRNTSALGRSCDTTACPAGYVCAASGSTRRCTLPCPAGAADCPTNFSCRTVNFVTAGPTTTSMPACLPN